MRIILSILALALVANHSISAIDDQREEVQETRENRSGRHRCHRSSAESRLLRKQVCRSQGELRWQG
ncbi:MAG: hypothetical protein IPJ85_03085 [Flavobacteriales bacterium]|nr:hypothetical protein [Flavobacteriales bacterium]